MCFIGHVTFFMANVHLLPLYSNAELLTTGEALKWLSVFWSVRLSYSAQYDTTATLTLKSNEQTCFIA